MPLKVGRRDFRKTKGVLWENDVVIEDLLFAVYLPIGILICDAFGAFIIREQRKLSTIGTQTVFLKKVVLPCHKVCILAENSVLVFITIDVAILGTVTMQATFNAASSKTTEGVVPIPLLLVGNLQHVSLLVTPKEGENLCVFVGRQLPSLNEEDLKQRDLWGGVYNLIRSFIDYKVNCILSFLQRSCVGRRLFTDKMIVTLFFKGFT